MPSIILPNTIDLNTQKSAPEIQSNFDAIQAGLNGGLDETNVPNLAAAFTTWKTIGWGGAIIPAGTAAGTQILLWGRSDGNANAVGATGSATLAFYLDPADYAANARTTKYRLRWVCLTNAVAPGANLIPGLYPVSVFGAPAAAAPSVATLGTVVTGSTPSDPTTGFTTPALNTQTVLKSAEFNAPAAGHYVLGVANGAVAASANPIILGQIQMRQV